MPNLRDNLVGAFRSMRNGTAMNPLATIKEIKQAENERMFGNGEVDGNNNWTPPVHGSTRDGRAVTVSFGLGSRNGETLICDGHVSRERFWGSRKKHVPKGHDHYLSNGTIASKNDRGKYAR